MAEHSGVWIVAEVAGGRLAAITLELLGIGRKLAADLGEELTAVFFAAAGDDELAKDLIAYGADQVYLLQSPLLATYEGDAYAAALAQACQNGHPSVLLLGQTALGRDLAPRAAFCLGTGVTLDCLELAIDPATRLLLQTKPVYGGSIRAVYVSESKPQMATVRVKAAEPATRQDGRTGEVVPLAIALDSAQIRTQTLERVEEKAEGVKLEDALVVVTGGGGLGDAANYRYVQELAVVLGGATGATRRIIDYGWVDSKLQVGLTGKVVSPDLYVAIALSGSSQHLAGCSGSRCIIAFNRDPEAPIFSAARFGVVGDYKQSVPAFMAKVKELLAE